MTGVAHMKILKFLALVGLLGTLAAISAAVFFFGGFFSVAATMEQPKVMEWALAQVRRASISHNATDLPPTDIANAALVRTGARAFSKRGCVNCHGAPGTEWQKYSEGLRPDPPDLKELADNREPRELFFVIKNGVNMTGMPSFAAGGVDDAEIWSIVAFVKRLPTIKDEDYQAWTADAPAKP
jgi:mono/diheme cytochrome c family protein